MSTVTIANCGLVLESKVILNRHYVSNLCHVAQQTPTHTHTEHVHTPVDAFHFLCGVYYMLAVNCREIFLQFISRPTRLVPGSKGHV